MLRPMELERADGRSRVRVARNPDPEAACLI